MAKKFKQIMTQQQFTETVKETADKEYPTYTTDMVNRDPKPVMPHIEEELDKIVEQDLKTKDLEDETSLLDAKIKEFREARAALNEAAKIIDKLYSDLIHATDETAVEIEYFRDIVSKFAEIIQKTASIKVSAAVDRDSMQLLHKHTDLTLVREKRQMDEHIENLNRAIDEAFDKNYRSLEERLSKDEGVYLTPKMAGWAFGLFMLLEAVACLAVVM